MPQEFANRFAALPTLPEGLKRRLVEDDIGVVPVPSVYVKEVSKLDVSSSQVRRNRRMVSYFLR